MLALVVLLLLLLLLPPNSSFMRMEETGWDRVCFRLLCLLSSTS